MQRRGDDEPHVAINAAGENMLAGARREPGVPEIVHAHRHDVVAGLHRVGDVKGEPGVAALVFADALAVHKHFRDLKHAVEFQIDALARPRRRHVKMFPIPAVADIKLVVRREIRHGKRVRQADAFPLCIVKCRCLGARHVAQLKCPFAVEIETLAQFSRRQSEH